MSSGRTAGKGKTAALYGLDHAVKGLDGVSAFGQVIAADSGETAAVLDLKDRNGAGWKPPERFGHRISLPWVGNACFYIGRSPGCVHRFRSLAQELEFFE